MDNIDVKLEKWKNKLLDLGRKNRLINFKESKRGTLKITTPNIESLFNELVVNEKTLSFPILSSEWVDDGEEPKIILGDLETNRTIEEQQKTLASLRSKARGAKEEQGINILYLCIGFLNWYESNTSKQELVSPLILVPVKISIESLADPYKLSIDEDEILVNPTLIYKLENDFGIVIPEFNPDEDMINEYLKAIELKFRDSKWTVNLECSLGLLSFLKINMYKDIENNANNMKAHPIVRAISGESGCEVEAPLGLEGYQHDRKTKPIEMFQVVDADSSQQDAILYSKKGCSFVLQGPPGTGKSQTITNIISECLADGKKILFVSEKMAALEVVYSRLASVGLNDFCLTLHSYKANKRDVLNQLYKMLNYDKVKLQREALYELNKLEIERTQLNDYDEAIHKNHEPINMSVYEINGKLSELQNVPNIIFDIDNIANVSKEKRNEYEYYLDAFSKTLGLMKNDFMTNPWRNCNVDVVTNELRHDIETYLRNLIPKLKKLSEKFKSCSDNLGLNMNCSLNSVDDLIEVLSVAENSPIIPLNWLNEESIAEISGEVKELSDIKIEYMKTFSILKTTHNEEHFNINAEEVRNKLRLSLENLKGILKVKEVDNEDNVVANIPMYLDVLKNANVFIESIKNISDEIEKLLEDKKASTIGSLNNKSELITLLNKRPMPSEAWFDEQQLIVVEEELKKVKCTYKEIENFLAELKNKYDESILKIDYQGILLRFKTDYTSFTKIFKRTYKEDKKFIASFAVNVEKKLEDEEVIRVLTLVKDINEKRNWLNENNYRIKTILGKRYIEKYTKWNELEVAVEVFKNIRTWFDGHQISNKVKEILLSDRFEDEIIEINKKLNKLLKENYINQANEVFNLSENIIEDNILDVQIQVNKYSNCAIELQSIYNSIVKNNITNLTFKEITNDLESLFRIQEISKKLKGKEETLKKHYEFLYKGLDTDFVEIQEMLNWMALYKEQINKNSIPIKFSEKVCIDKEFIKSISSYLEDLKEQSEECSVEKTWIMKLFDLREEILDSELDDVIKRFEICLNSLVDLEYWIDYRSSRANCRKVGLGSFIDKVEEIKLESNLVVDVFCKRFYRLLLDAIISDSDILKCFRRRLQDERIKEFRILDKEQFKIAKVRIKERLINQLPNTNSFTSSMDEIGILKREFNKQRRIMPLRKLFKSIPNLILTLKPCLMMSPLSVSLFLESENFKFDVVIFDEASQVCTENAIGAIYRGKQVIIAGDSKQLPPTNFFNSNTSLDLDFDASDEDEDIYNDTDGYESVLDEALTALPERTLKWHYRSRHEHLITFSNIKIYGGDLTTFPSNVDKVPDNGVEYIYVENGVYERGGKKCNSIEADRVAELVFEHMNKYPNRSLGVVTFSEAQQDAINVTLKKRRMENPRFEKYFNEDLDTPFFVKNLENVQGDERDTIIFSIGYAKDITGKMYMNFGPVSRTGGYRRLNVAITRAKFNVKLVGSILPTDIDLDRTSSEGVRMLRSYMEFAMKGPKALVGELTVPDIVALESPFEESVYNFLVNKGYNVSSQVGCSGYRIDLAVKHPTINGVYVLAVECDGATYHSARTARERDRLRQTVLEDIGWKVYRIWSVDWIKDPITEGNRLIEAVEKAIAQYGCGDTFLENECELENNESSKDKETCNYLKTVSENHISSNSEDYGFVLYQEADITEINRNQEDVYYLKEVISLIIEKEQPIHFELLCKRIAGLFGNQKVTVKIRNSANYIITQYLNNKIEDVDDFYWLKGNKTTNVRIPNSDIEYVRPINFICKEEIAEAIKAIVKSSFGITKDSLFNVIIKVFGFSRLGPKISKAIDESFQYLIDSSVIEEIEGKLRCIEE